MLTGRSDRVDRMLDPQRPVVYSKGPKHVFADRTLPASGQMMSPLCASRQCTSALTGRTLPASGRRATQRPIILPTPASSLLHLTGHAGPTEASVQSLPVTSVYSI